MINISSTSISLQAIMRAFRLIARFNTLIKSQRYIELSILYKYILNARRAYQELITYATPAAEGFRNHNYNVENDDDSEDADALNEVLSEAARSNSGSEMREI